MYRGLRFLDVDRANGADEHAENAKLGDEDERRDDLLGKVHRDHRRKVRQLMPPEEPPAAHANGDRSHRERCACEPVDLRADHAIRTGPACEEQSTDEDEDARVGLHERLHEEERDERRGDRSDKLGDRLREQTYGSPPASDGGNHDTGEDAAESGEQDDRERCARAREHDAEEVPPEYVRAEGEHEAGVVRTWIATVLDDEVDRLVRRDAFAEQRDEEKREEREERSDHQRVGSGQPEVRPLTTPSGLERRRDPATHGRRCPSRYGTDASGQSFGTTSRHGIAPQITGTDRSISPLTRFYTQRVRSDRPWLGR